MRVLRNLATLALRTLVLGIILGETVFRFAIPASAQPWGYYDPVDKVAKFEVGQGTGLYTLGKTAQFRAKWRINNAGWNSDVDYVSGAKRERPLIAIIGDSMVEGFHVDVEENIASVLRAKVHGQYDVYAFGKSGAPLSAYLQTSRYVIKHYNPAVIVMTVVHNDFDMSLRHVRPVPHFLQVKTTDAGIEETRLPSTPVTVRPRTRLLFKSAIVRYLWNNLNYGVVLTELRTPKQIGGRESRARPEIRPEVYRATEYLVRKIREETAGRELIFLMDAPRRDIYAGTLQTSSEVWMNEMLREMATRHRSRFVDLTKPLSERYKKDGVRLDFAEIDGHWNEEGHRYAAEVLYQNLVKFGIVKDRP